MSRVLFAAHRVPRPMAVMLGFDTQSIFWVCALSESPSLHINFHLLDQSISHSFSNRSMVSGCTGAASSGASDAAIMATLYVAKPSMDVKIMDS